MRRFMGLMPSEDVEISRSYEDNMKSELIIEAGPHGWTIIYADKSTSYVDSERCTELNFREAWEVANDEVGPIRYLGENLLCEIDVSKEF